MGLLLGWCQEREKIDWQEPLKFGADNFYFLLSLVNFHQTVASGPENQILISDWTYFHRSSATLMDYSKSCHREIQFLEGQRQTGQTLFLSHANTVL